MKRILGVLLILAVGVVGGVLAARLLSKRRAGNMPTVLTVNDESISMQEMESQLKVTYGGAALQSLLHQLLVLQQARALKLQLTPSEQKIVASAQEKSSNDPVLRQSAARVVEAGLLARKIILKDVPESELREIHKLFEPQLRRYELHAILLPTRAEVDVVLGNLRQGGDFAEAARTYSVDPSKARGGLLGSVSLDAVEQYLGRDTRTRIETMKVGTITPPLDCPRGVVILKLGKIYSSFDELRPVIQELVVDARRDELLYDLYVKADVKSPFMNQPAPLAPAATPGELIPTPTP